MLPRFHSTPLLLQGGDVGQQAFMVELLQLQELNGPLVWWGWQLKSGSHGNNTHRAFTPPPEDTNIPDLLTGRWTVCCCQGNRKNTGGKPYRCEPSGFEPKYGQHPETAHNNTGRYWEVLGGTGRNWEELGGTGTFTQMSTSLKHKGHISRIQSSLAR